MRNYIPLIVSSFTNFFKNLSYGFFFISLLYLFSSLSFSFMLFIIDWISEKNLLTLSSLKLFPNFEKISLLFLLVSIFFLYVGFKVKNGSRFSFWLGIISSFFPFLIGWIAQIFLIKSFSYSSQIVQKLSSKVDFISAILNLRKDDPIIILCLLCFFVMLFSFKKFYYFNTPLNKKEKIIMLGFSIFFLILVGAPISFASIRYFDKDFGFTKAQRAVSYHVYRPIFLPSKYEYATKYNSNQSLAGKNNGVSVVFDLSMEDIMKTEKTSPIWFKQVAVEEIYSPRKFY